MARSDSTAAPTLAPIQIKREPAALHQAFSWLDASLKNNLEAQFAALTMDVSNGVQTCLQLIHSDSLTRAHNKQADPGQEVEPVLSEAEGERLLMLATAAVRILSEKAEAQIDALNKQAEKQAAAGGRA